MYMLRVDRLGTDETGQKGIHMEKKQLKAFYLDPIAGVAEERTIADDLHTFYDMLGCRCIDIQARKVGKRVYDFIIDDEGLFSEDLRYTAVTNGCSLQFVGALLVVGTSDDEGNLTSLEDSDIENLKRHTQTLPYYNEHGRRENPIIVGVEFC